MAIAGSCHETLPSAAPHRAAWILAITLLATACGDDADADGDDGSGDGSDAGDASDGGDDGEACVLWTLAQPDDDDGVTAINLDVGPQNADKTVRVFVQTSLDGCEEPAIPQVVVSEARATVDIQLRVWRKIEGACAGEKRQLVRAIPLRFAAAGTWTIRAGGKQITAEIEPAPDRACGVPAGTACAMDCDCGAGERCLSGSGLAGPFTQCGRTCELDRDCAGLGLCESIADGLSNACTGGAECAVPAPGCLDGWTCSGGVCQPDFELNVSTRTECACDGDCAEPLRCVRLAGRPGRCEILCPTEGAWCEGAHVCGDAAMDAAGLAEADSVCVFLGE
jgi:hypothetical protein